MTERNPIFRERRRQEAEPGVMRDSKQPYSQKHAVDLESHEAVTKEDFRHRMEDKLAKAQHEREDTRKP
jgi:hypothetical protein